MERSWKAMHWASLAALMAFILSVMAGAYAVTYAILVVSVMGGMAYMISAAQFKDRPDGAHPKRSGS